MSYLPEFCIVPYKNLTFAFQIKFQTEVSNKQYNIHRIWIKIELISLK